MDMWRTVLSEVLELLFPRSPIDRIIDHISPDTLAAQARGPIVRFGTTMLAPLQYEQRCIRELVHAAKYRGHARAPLVLGEAIAPFVAEELADRRSFGEFHAPLILPIPLHPLRERARGYNQSERIAAALARMLGLTEALSPHLLVRVRMTKSQARTTHKTERIENMLDAFGVPDPTLVDGRSIVLVDDVITTGATMYAARDALLEAGARDILCVAAAH